MDRMLVNYWQKDFAELAPILGVVDRMDNVNKLRRMGDQPLVHIGFMRLDKWTVAETLGVRELLETGRR